MFKNLGKLKNLTKKKFFQVNISQLKTGVNVFDNFIIFKKKSDLKIYDRKCDHAGGKIISKGGNTICPMHMWKFNPATGFYDNGVKKKEVEYSIHEDTINIVDISYTPEIEKVKKKLKTKVRFFNHAFLNIAGDDFSFSIDPWAIGPAFNTGWWLQYSTKNDWIENLNNSNFIYISHNHPDHLHPLTLSKINKTIPIVVPNFLTQSTENYIKHLGFKNIQVLDFNSQYNLKGTNLNISILKSGDFREDSGIYFSNGEFTSLFSVDSNMINFDRLPKVNFYGSSFAGGATSYPLMFDNYNLDEQIKISQRDKNFVKKKVYDCLNKISPDYYMPYAGFFSEKLMRDKKVFQNNNKNSIDDYINFCNSKKISLLNVHKNDSYTFNGIELVSKKNIDCEMSDDLKPEKYLEYYKKEFDKIDENYLKNYFQNSNFQDNLLLYICLTDDNFKKINKNYLINFSNKKIEFIKIFKFSKSLLKKNPNIRKLVLKIRKESFLNTIYNKLPWEDLSIGFQCKIFRDPNIYNASFWHHFTNIYTTPQNVRSVTECASCESLSHFFDNQIHNS